MDHASPDLDSIKRQLMSQNKPKKPKMLVVDDEPDNLDLLYRTFRRDFNVFKADSGIKALEVLENEGEVAVIISDQRMPEMKGTEFLSKTVPQFPNTVRIILTGFTDIEDLVDAINSGQVYKYITKPWDPNELKVVVQRAAETYELLNQRTEELMSAQKQTELIITIMGLAQTADSVASSLEPMATALGEHWAVENCIIQLIDETGFSPTVGVYSRGGKVENWLSSDPLVSKALESQALQASINIANDPNLSGVAHYQSSGIQAHIAIPVVYRGKLTAIISLQWSKPCSLLPDEITTVNLSSQQVALVLASLKSR
jgi:CheY-like chemotaxis protein